MPPASPAVQHALWEQPAILLNEDAASGQMNTFETFGGVSLSDDLQMVTDKLGEPDSTVEEPYTGFIEYRYGDTIVGTYEGMVYYISQGSRPEEIDLNGVRIPLKDFWLHYYLGDPDFLAEDGDVYIRGHYALKIFRDESGAITAVDLFDDSVS